MCAKRTKISKKNENKQKEAGAGPLLGIHLRSRIKQVKQEISRTVILQNKKVRGHSLVGVERGVILSGSIVNEVNVTPDFLVGNCLTLVLKFSAQLNSFLQL